MSKPPYIIHVKKLWGEWTGITIYPFIFTTLPDDKEHIRHEMVHIRQQLDGWLIGFYIKYAYYHLRYGYKNNPYEIEAREPQDEHAENL